MELQPPPLQGRALFDKAYHRAVNRYFTDNFPFRSLLRYVSNLADYRIFSTSNAKQVYVGADGWLYPEKSIKRLYNYTDYDPADIERLVLTLCALERIVTATGRRFYFVMVPEKASIYPEFTGIDPSVASRNPSSCERLCQYAKIYGLESLLRADRPLLAAKGDAGLLYDKTATHWNAMGAKVAAEFIQSRVFQSEPRFVGIYQDQR
ncbi:MAG: hypothetical protein JRH15_03395 [Deltaproteobacteria bacterium]|nr:hypothetical protein [Deltaproteobacteria bacterium]